MEARQLTAIKIFISFMMITVLFSCNDDVGTHEYSQTHYNREIITTLIDKFTKPIPKPPAPNSEKIDTFTSVQNKVLRVGINPKMQSISLEYSSQIDEIFTSLNTEIEINYNQEQILDVDVENIQKQGKYLTRGYVETGEKGVFHRIDILYNFSTISYNQDYTKAVLIIGVSRGKLNGFADLLVLEKVKGKWQIIKRKNLQIS